MDPFSEQDHFAVYEYSLADDDDVHPLTEALLGFEACRSQVAQATGFDLRRRRVPEPFVREREAVVRADMHRIHDRLGEADRLRMYRFFLLATHRQTLRATRFEPRVLASSEASAAAQAAYGAASDELDDLVGEVSEHCLVPDRRAAWLLASEFLWVMAWWVHAREDVLSFLYSPEEDAFAVLLLGRPPDPQDRMPREVYDEAAAAELAYRSYAMREEAPVEQEVAAVIEPAAELGPSPVRPGRDWHL